MLMLPREHGAYSQMALPLVTTFVVAGVTLPAALTALAVILGFLAHEPLLVLLGRRGARVAADAAARAKKMLALGAGAMLVVGVAALLLAPVRARWGFALPAIPVAVVAAGLLTKREKSAAAEIAVAVAFSLAAVPIALAAGAPTAIALSMATAFALVFIGGVLAVRVVILKVRAGGNPRAVRRTRLTLITLAAAGVATLGIAAARGGVPWAPLLAVLPGLTAALALAFRATAPRLKTVGWTLMSTSTAAALILMLGL